MVKVYAHAEEGPYPTFYFQDVKPSWTAKELDVPDETYERWAAAETAYYYAQCELRDAMKWDD